MELIFERLEEGIQKQGSRGPYYVNVVHGYKIYQGKKSSYKKEFFASNKDLSAVFKAAKAGCKINLTFTEDQYKNLATATIIGGGAPPEAEEAPKNDSKPSTPNKSYGQFRDPSEIIRTDALDKALNLVTAELQSAGTFSKLLKKTLTQNALKMEVLGLASDFEKFIKGQMVMADPESNDSDLEGEEADIPQDDIPY